MEGVILQSKILKVGEGVIHNIAETLLTEKIAGKILYVSDDVVDKLYGNLVKKQVKEVGELIEEFVTQNTIAYALMIAEKVIETDICCIVGVGGGKVLDVCKYAAYITKRPFLSVPTTVANDGLVSPIAVLKRQDGKPKSLGCCMASMVLIDTKVICAGPSQLTKAGIGDTISNYMALLDWDLACMRGKDKMNGYAYLMSKNSLDMLMNTQYNSLTPAFVEELINSLVLSGIAMDFAGSSRPVSGSEHLFSHALDYYCKIGNLHGIQTALGTVAMLKIIEKDQTEVMNYLNRFKVEINPQKLSIDVDTFVYCMQNAPQMRINRYTYLNEVDLSRDTLVDVYNELVREL